MSAESVNIAEMKIAEMANFGGTVDQVLYEGRKKEEKRKGENSGTLEISSTVPLGFDPEKVYYYAPKGSFFIDTGDIFRQYTRKSPVANGIARFLDTQGQNQSEAIAKQLLADIEIDRAVDWSGELAGYNRGLTMHHGKSLLITKGPDLIPPDSSQSFPVITSIIDQIFPDTTAKTIFLLWLKLGLDAVRQRCHCPAPMLVIAGGVNCGKSLLAWMVQTVLGGRVANPLTAWSGGLPWNDDLAAAELLLVDDCTSSTDIRSRRQFGANFKEAIYGPEVQINKRNTSSMTFRPVWRVMICCNEEPDNLAVIPPIDSDMSDKVILLKAEKVSLPVDTSNPEGKSELRKLIAAELSGFIAHLACLSIPEDLCDSRSGVMAWKDPRLLKSLDCIAPHGQLEQLIADAIESGQFFEIENPGDCCFLSAASIQSTLCDNKSPTKFQAQSLLKYHKTTGKLLAYLSDNKSPFVTDTRTYNGSKQYLITKPQIDE